MSYDEDMAVLFPAVLSAGAETANQRPPFRVARRFQDVSECHCAAATATRMESQRATLIDTDQSQSAHALRTKSDSVYSPLARTAEIRVLEILPAKFEQQICGSLHHVTMEERECPRSNNKCQANFAVSASEAAVVCYTALSYVVRPSSSVD